MSRLLQQILADARLVTSVLTCHFFLSCSFTPCYSQGPTSVKLDSRAFIVLGRSGDADVKLEGKLCSRKHATIAFDPNKGNVYITGEPA